MKCFVLILIFGLQFIPALIAAAVSDQRIAEFISSSHIDEDGGVSFDPSLNLTSVEVDSFKEWFRQADDPVEKIRPLVIDDQKRGVALHFAAASLDDDHFYRVCLNTLRKFANGEIREKELYYALRPPEEKRGILAIHFRDQNLAFGLRGCLGRGLTNPAYTQIIKSILSGDAAKDVFRNAGESFPERYGPLAQQALENISIPAHSGADKLTSHPPEPKNAEPKVASTGDSETASAFPPHSIWPWIAGAVFLILGAVVLLKRRS